MVRGAIAVKRRSAAIVRGAIDKGYKLSCDDRDRQSAQFVHRGVLITDIDVVWLVIVVSAGTNAIIIAINSVI